MKNFFSFITFYLISGSVHCFDVISYPAGRVIILFMNPQITSSVYFCKYIANTECKDLITAQFSELNNVIHKDRIGLFYTRGKIALMYRNLSLQDTGMYQIGDFSRWNYNINLKVISDPCCSGTKAVTGHLGQTLMISCFYPVEFETNPKSFYRIDDFSGFELFLTSGTEQHQDYRFSISDDRKNKVFSVNITNLRKDDGGLYFCAVDENMLSFRYLSSFTVIQLQVTEVTKDTTENTDVKSDTSESEVTKDTTENPDVTSDTSESEVTKDTTENPDGTSDTSESAGSTTIIIITVVICVLLLLGVVTALIFYKQLWKKLQGTFERNVSKRLSQIPHYDEIKDHIPHADTAETAYYSVIPLTTIHANTVYATAELPTIPSDHPNTVYATAELPTIHPNNVYATAELPSIPSDHPNALYATAELPTIPSDHANNVYATAELPTIPSDHPNNVYATAELPTIPSDHPNNVYATAELPSIPSDHPNALYATAELPTIPSDHPNNVYATAELPTIPSDHPNNVYATAELPTIPSDHPNNVYATAELPTIPSDHPNNVYATAELPTIPSDHPNNVYATAELPTIPSDHPTTCL
ncbi:uncharacterized protein LOC113646401 isoform X4 [Tachysurus fulvidraco]|uniref:uncharacterized protein LOC113646401 isoform X4 n=1 Tax=Tachysurus fulvidraco TaxID=1234273 RepID=UPI001FEE3A53|nr:uncharacterized protein LOC113646401 isoform X4 [Tachysurus fulvidraco]